MIRFVIGVIRLYFGLGVIFGTIVFGSILYQYFAMERVKESLGTVIGDALLAAFFRFLLWAPQLWQALMYANRSFVDRSEEHTSELQSPMRISYAVFCLKKK